MAGHRPAERVYVVAVAERLDHYCFPRHIPVPQWVMVLVRPDHRGDSSFLGEVIEEFGLARAESVAASEQAVPFRW